MSTLDARLHACREDLADESLRGKVEASHWVKATPAQVCVGVAPVHKRPDETAMQLTQALQGETCHVFERKTGWAWVQLSRDGYVGYVREAALAAPSHATATHRVSNVSTWRFPKPDLKSQPATALYMNSEVAVKEVQGNYALLESGGAVFAGHLSAVEKPESDFVTVAEKFLHVPYLWGGKTCAGTDCSGLVQSALHASGIICPRDSDMQEKQLGEAIAIDSNLRRGDLIFWPGHVGIMQSATQLLHANGHFMMVTSEPLAAAVARSEKPVSAVRRLSAKSPNPAAK
ncbi:MAG: C40 family peptidase [Alphaproteobacteria bacterium]|nr:C40 family peptidase [Alphaproteobacteria bacterium]